MVGIMRHRQGLNVGGETSISKYGQLLAPTVASQTRVGVVIMVQKLIKRADLVDNLTRLKVLAASLITTLSSSQ